MNRKNDVRFLVIQSMSMLMQQQSKMCFYLCHGDACVRDMTRPKSTNKSPASQNQKRVIRHVWSKTRLSKAYDKTEYYLEELTFWRRITRHQPRNIRSQGYKWYDNSWLNGWSFLWKSQLFGFTVNICSFGVNDVLATTHINFRMARSSHGGGDRMGEFMFYSVVNHHGIQKP